MAEGAATEERHVGFAVPASTRHVLKSLLEW